MNNLFEKLQAKARAGRKPAADAAPKPTPLPEIPETPAAQVDARRAAEMTAEAAGDAARCFVGCKVAGVLRLVGVVGNEGPGGDPALGQR